MRETLELPEWSAVVVSARSAISSSVNRRRLNITGGRRGYAGLLQMAAKPFRPPPPDRRSNSKRDASRGSTGLWAINSGGK